MFRNRSTEAVIGTIIAITLSIAFIIFAITATLKFAFTPDTPPQPTNVDKAVQACIKSGGVPITSSRDKETGDPVGEYFDKCQYKTPTP